MPVVSLRFCLFLSYLFTTVLSSCLKTVYANSNYLISIVFLIFWKFCSASFGFKSLILASDLTSQTDNANIKQTAKNTVWFHFIFVFFFSGTWFDKLFFFCFSLTSPDLTEKIIVLQVDCYFFCNTIFGMTPLSSLDLD